MNEFKVRLYDHVPFVFSSKDHRGQSNLKENKIEIVLKVMEQKSVSFYGFWKYSEKGYRGLRINLV